MHFALTLALGGALACGAVLAQTELPEALTQWRSAHSQIRWAPERDYPPMVYETADGQAAGLSVELLQRVAREAGVQLQALPAASLHELLQAAADRKLDLLTSLRPTPERAQHLLFTQPYVALPAVLVQRATDAALSDLAELHGRKVAVGKGYAVEAVMRQRHPQVLWQSVASDAEGLKALAKGGVDAVVADVASVAFVVQRNRLAGLRVGAQVGFDYELAFAVRRDWPELRELLDHAIAAVPHTERQAILQRWLTGLVPAELPPRAPVATRLGLLLLVLAALAGLWAWRRQRRHGPPDRSEGG